MIYTYAGIKTEVETRLSLMSSWNTTLYFGVYSRITDLLAYTASKLVYLADYLYNESKWIAATSKKSMLTMSKLLNYTPYRKVGAIGTILFSADSAMGAGYTYTGLEIFIPKWTKFTNTDKTVNVYNRYDTHYYTGTIGNLDILVREGIPKEFLYIATGALNETIYIYSSIIDNYEIELFIVDSTETVISDVVIVDKLYFINDTITYNCEISTSSNEEYISIIFGDGINSRKLIAGERVLIKYAETNGYSGNITSLNIINTVESILYDENGDVGTFYVKNSEGILGGSEAEDIESIRNNANNLFQIGQLLSSRENWIAAINSAPYVVNSVVWSIEELGGTISGSDQNIVTIVAISNTGTDLTTTQEDDLKLNYLYPKKSITEVVQFSTLEKIYARFNVVAKIINNTIAVNDANIKTTLTNAYGVLNTTFQSNIYESNFYSVINSITDLAYHETEIFYMEKNKEPVMPTTTLFASYTIFDQSISDPDTQSYMQTDSFEIWIKRKIANVWSAPVQIGQANGTSIDPVTTFTFSGDVLDYTYNTYAYSINEIVADITQTIYGVQNPGDADPLGYILYICYKMKDGNTPAGQLNSLRLPYFYQISDIDTDFVTTSLSYL